MRLYETEVHWPCPSASCNPIDVLMIYVLALSEVN